MITSLTAALEMNFTLQWLDLGNNGLSAECGINFASALREKIAVGVVGGAVDSIKQEFVLCEKNNKQDTLFEIDRLSGLEVGLACALGPCGLQTLKHALQVVQTATERLSWDVHGTPHARHESAQLQASCHRVGGLKGTQALLKLAEPLLLPDGKVHTARRICAQPDTQHLGARPPLPHDGAQIRR